MCHTYQPLGQLPLFLHSWLRPTPGPAPSLMLIPHLALVLGWMGRWLLLLLNSGLLPLLHIGGARGLRGASGSGGGSLG